MVNSWWTCSRSYRHCVQSWRLLDGHLHYLLLMMSDCPLAICQKKGEYIWMDFLLIRGDFVVVLELWSFRLYLGASLCTYFLAHEVFILMSSFLWVAYDRGRHYVFIFVSCFTLCYIDYWFIFMRLFIIYVL